MRNHILAFLRAGKRIRASARSKCRPHPDDFEKAVDYCCIMHHMLEEAAKQFPEKDFGSLKQAVDNRLVPIVRVVLLTIA